VTALVQDYCTLAELKAHLTTAQTTDDAELAICITAASRAIDAATYRKFGLAPAATARLYSWHGEYLDDCVAIPVDDVQTTTGFAVTVDSLGDYTYSTTLTLSTDFDLWPYNAAGDGVPWTHMLLRPTSTASWPRDARAFNVTGKWGWTTVPSLVEIACLIQAGRWYMRKFSWAGIAGSPDLGNEIRLLAKLDPDVEAALAPVTRFWGAV
jgi:hypothetical protein